MVSSNTKYFIKTIALIMAVPTTLVVLVGYLYHQTQLEKEISLMKANETVNTKVAVHALSSNIHGLISDIKIIVDQTKDHISVNNLTNYRQLTDLMMLYSNKKKYYDQIRLIKKNGAEFLRVNFNEVSGATIVPRNRLQNKKNRYYFIEAIKLRSGEIYLSPLDLNIEQGKIESPLKPVMRIAIPINDAFGNRWGIVIVNYLAKYLIHDELEMAISNIHDHTMLLNSNGYWLHHPDESKEWGFLFDKKELYQKYWPEEWQIISALDSGQIYNEHGLITFSTIYPLIDILNGTITEAQKMYNWKIVSHNMPEVINAIKIDILKRTYLITGPIYAILFIISWVLAVNLRKRLEVEKNLKKSYDDLEKRVIERTIALKQEVNEKQKAVSELKKSIMAIEKSPLPIIIVNKQGIIEYANPMFAKSSGPEVVKLLNKKNKSQKSDLNDPQTYKKLWKTINSGKVWHGEFINKRVNGEIYPESATIAPVKDDFTGKISHYICILRDITQEKKSEEDLLLALTVFNNSSNGIVITDEKSKILRVNKAFTKITGYKGKEIQGKNPSVLKSGSHNLSFYEKMWKTIKRTGHWQGEMINRNKKGEIYPEWLNITAVQNLAGNITHYIGIFSDITERKLAEAQIKHLAYFDLLTDLPNRSLLVERLKQSIVHSERNNLSFALLFIDLDGFKLVNDSLGHDVGDKLLIEVATRLANTVRAEDTVARIGGDEFILLISQISSDREEASSDVARMAKKIIESIAKPSMIDDHELFIIPSIGVAIYPNDGKNAQEMMKHADAAMYQAKEKGRNNFQFFTKKMKEHAMGQLKLENAIKQAIKKEQFTMYYQPQVEIDSGKITGAEALIRWHHPQSGLIPNQKFIPLCEQTGQINALGNWVIQDVFKTLKTWESAISCEHGCKVAINISPRQLQATDFIKKMEYFINKAKVNPKLLELEMTEGVFAFNIDEITGKLKDLKSMGFNLSLDDFGTGYSSLSYLQRFPLDVLKIDQSFIKNIVNNKNDAAIVETIINISHTMGYRVIAEGVEDKKQLDFLKKLGCNSYQGYYFSKAIAADKFQKLLKKI